LEVNIAYDIIAIFASHLLLGELASYTALATV
jgi:hypothetical protein